MREAVDGGNTNLRFDMLYSPTKRQARDLTKEEAEELEKRTRYEQEITADGDAMSNDKRS